MEQKKKTASDIAKAVNAGEISARRIIEDTLARCNTVNESLNTFRELAGAEALENADRIDEKIAGGSKLPLAGVPLAVKDDFCYSEMATSFGSPAFKAFQAPYSAAAVEKMTEAGAVVIGKTNLDDMGIGSSTLSSFSGPALNPWSPERVAGSAGAASIASGQALLALESDSGGALRQGASHCGVFGLRPTIGRISRYGLNMFSSSFGQAGLSAASTIDILTALRVISGFDERDVATAICRDMSIDDQTISKPDKNAIGYPFAIEGLLEQDQLSVFKQSCELFRSAGHNVTGIEMALLPEALRAYYIIAFAEVSSNLSRFDGIRFGESVDAANLEELYTSVRGYTFGPESRRRSIIGTILLGKDNFDRYYRQALKVWRLVREQFNAAFNECQLLLLPVTPSLPQLASAGSGLLGDYENDIFCAPVSLSGLPSLSLPTGGIDGLPAGVQLIGPAFSEELLLNVGSRVVQRFNFPPEGAF